MLSRQVPGKSLMCAVTCSLPEASSWLTAVSDARAVEPCPILLRHLQKYYLRSHHAVTGVGSF